MNKTLAILLLFYIGGVFAQPSPDAVVSSPDDSLYQQIKAHIEPLPVNTTSFPENLKEQYQESDFIYEAALTDKGGFTRLKERFASWLESIFNIRNRNESMQWVDNIINILAVLIVLIVIYFITKAILNKEGQWVFGKPSDKKIISHEEIGHNIHEVDFEKTIKETLQSGDYRLATRYYYLWILKKMAGKGIIEWHAEKTNTDYIYEIHLPEIRKQFEYTSYLYTYIWYGAFDIDKDTFQKAREAFEKNLKAI